jgi:cell division protein FtsL
MRILNLCVVALLLLAAAYVYEIKYDSTLRAERVAKMRSDIRRERDAIAALRAEWAQLDNPARLQGLVHRHLPLGPTKPHQFDSLDRLPMRPPKIVQPPHDDAIATMIENPDGRPPDDHPSPPVPAGETLDQLPTGSVPPVTPAR